MITEDIRTTAADNLTDLRLCQEKVTLRDSRIRDLLSDKAGLEQEKERLMMEGEDIFANYYREWKISDERRYLLQKAERGLGDERRVREKLKADFEEALAQFEKERENISSR